jgi:GT2 family glycosyltransferase
MILGIPVLNRPDLLQRVLRAVDYPTSIFVVCNATVERGPETVRSVRLLCTEHGAHLAEPGRNLGVAGSWNAVLRAALGDQGRDWALIGSNDCVPEPGTLKAIAATLSTRHKPDRDPRVGVWHACGWDLFAVTAGCVDAAGTFDEGFYPAYHEDQDYHRRCMLAGIAQIEVPEARCRHEGSATIRSDPALEARCRVTHPLCAQRYRDKWGGDFGGGETHVTPYGDPSMTVRDWRPLTEAERKEREW